MSSFDAVARRVRAEKALDSFIEYDATYLRERAREIQARFLSELDELIAHADRLQALPSLAARELPSSADASFKLDPISASARPSGASSPVKPSSLSSPQATVAAVANRLALESSAASSNSDMQMRGIVFQSRESELMRMLSLDDVQAIYHIFTSAFIFYLISSVLTDVFERGSLFQFELLQWAFDGWFDALRLWVILFAASLTIVPLQRFWASRRINTRLYFFLHGSLQVSLFALILPAVLALRLPPASALIVVLELIRVSLKLYSFVRETYSQRVHGYWAYADPNLTNHTSSSSAESLTAAMDGAADEKQQADSQNQTKLSTPVKTKKPSSTLTQTELRRSSRIKELQQKRESSDDGESVYTSASSASSSSSSSSSAPVPQPASSKKNMEKQPDLWWPFIYFLFAPTLIYRDHYPRTPRIRWKFVARRLLELVGCIFFAYVVLHQFCIPVFASTATVSAQSQTWLQLINSVFAATLPGSMLFILIFFMIFHCWLNAVAELTRFADRRFYGSWWSATTLTTLYRKFTLVSYDWVHSYLYSDLCAVGLPASFSLAISVVFTLVLCESVVRLAFGMFYPLLSAIAIVGLLLVTIFQGLAARIAPPQLMNTLMWTALLLMNGALLVLFAREWYARQSPLSTHIDPTSWMPYSWQLMGRMPLK